MFNRARSCSLYLALLTPALFAQGPAAVATYEFRGNLNANQALVTPLTAANPLNQNRYFEESVLGLPRTVYQLASDRIGGNAGLTLPTNGLLSPTSYSVEMLFAFTEGNSTWRRVLDASDRTVDNGLYINTANRFEPYGIASPGQFVYQTNSYVHLVVTVSDNQVRAYANGAQDLSFTNSILNITNSRGVLHFFLDNTSGGTPWEYASAKIALLRAYNRPLTATEAANLARDPFANLGGTNAPQFTSGGVRNGASFSESNPVAPGAFFSILGSALSDATGDWSASFTGRNAPTTLNGTRVLINDRPAFISYTSPTQINAIAPDGISGIATVVVERNGVRSPVATVNTRRLNPAFFAYSQRNGRYIATVAADNSAYIAPADLFGVSSIGGLAVRPARPGEFVVAYGMGMGPTNPALPAGEIPPVREGGHPITGAVSLTFGTGRSVTPLYVGLSSFAGVYIVVFQVPQLPPGDYEVVISVDGIASPQGVNIQVAP